MYRRQLQRQHGEGHRRHGAHLPADEPAQGRDTAAGVLRKCRLVVKDPSKVLLSADTLDKLAVREVALETEDAAKTLCVTVNPVSTYGWKFDKDEFLSRMKEAVDVPVINVKEELA